jgi:ribulose bisphosphate carboxylase small subunit
MKYLVVSLLLFSLVSCVTPMNQSDIEAVTTCKDTTLADIRRNLLLQGFKIDQESKTDLVTDFKQTDFWQVDRQFLRISAVEVEEKTFKLKVSIFYYELDLF